MGIGNDNGMESGLGNQTEDRVKIKTDETVVSIAIKLIFLLEHSLQLHDLSCFHKNFTEYRN